MEIRNLSALLDYHDLITSIVTALEERDAYTSHHSMRVADMTEQICLLLRKPSQDMIPIHIAAHIHDIGKIGIEDAVLRKAGPLDDGEWKKIKEHPEIGYRILNKINRFTEIARIVRHHHERWDGKGYPDGLTRYQIPLGARIIAVADSIDAMMSDRSYRKGMASDACKAEIHKNAGGMYDPEIAQTVLEHWDKIVASRQDFLGNNTRQTDSFDIITALRRDDSVS